MDSNRLKKPSVTKISYKERAKNGSSTKTKAAKSGGKMGKCKGGCM
jgi:hypothetical protein